LTLQELQIPAVVICIC